MSLEASSIPLALVAGMLSILSPCVWPLVPAIMASAGTSGRTGPWFLVLGLCVAFAAAGTVLVYALLTFDLDPELLRYIAAFLLLAIAATLLSQRLGAWVAYGLSRLTSRSGTVGAAGRGGPAGQFGVGALLGIVWLPCVGPTLGAAIALASLGQNMPMAFVVMFAFGMGTASVLLLASFASARALDRLRPGMMRSAEVGRKVLGWTLLMLAVLVLTGLDKMLEAWALQILPDWAVSL